MDNRSVPSSPAHHQVQNHGQQESGSQERLQPTPPSAFQFPGGVGIPPTAQSVLNQPGYPLQAHLLVDPVTGQHYIVPQPYYPQMQPMYYPPPQTQPMYFHQYQKGAPTPQPQMYMGMPMYNGLPTTSRSDSGTGTKEKSSDGNQDEKAGEEDTMSITSNTSRNSFNLMQNPKIGPPQFGIHRENSRDYMYRTPTVNLPQDFEYAQPLRSPMARPLALHRLESDPSRGGTQSDFEGRAPKNNYAEVPHASSSDVETARRNYTRIPAAPISENEVETEVLLNEEEKKPKPAPSKSIRMEINLADVPTLPRDSKPARRSNATAFTVNIGGEREVSLQEAARNLAENRRKKLENKLSEDRPEREQLPSNKANKNYLLGKLLTGKNSTNQTNSNELVDSSPDIEAASEVGSSRDFDARSEALTFIIDTSKRTNPVFYNQNQYQSKVVQYSDDDDSSSESEIMEQYSQRSAAPKVEPPPKPAPKIDPPRQLPSPRVVIPPVPNVSKPVSVGAPAPSTSTSSTPRTPTSFNRSTGSNSNSDFLQELAKLRMMAGLPASGVGGSDSDSRKTTTSAFRRAEATSSARSPTVSSTQKVVSTRASFNSRTKEGTIPTTVTPTPSRKSESRRSLTGNSSPQLSNMARPPFRTGAPRGIMIGQSEQQREQERNAWLRRKDYNPMKSAAAGRKTSDQRAREQQFTSRRSLTFHPSNTEDFGGQSPSPAMSRPARNRSQEPRDMRSEKYRAGGGVMRRGDEPKLTGLAKAVDMLSKKCKKSIELIRIQNKGCLSVSVEDLLTAAAEEPRLNESLDEQLERLSDAFDAVQRYLEQYSLDGYNSPVPESYYDEEDESVESHSTFSGVSTHQNHQSGGESISSSYRRKVLDS